MTLPASWRGISLQILHIGMPISLTGLKNGTGLWPVNKLITNVFRPWLVAGA